MKKKSLKIILLLVLLLLPVKWTLAHGGGILQAGNVPIASYQVSVWTNPPTARAGQPLHVTVGVATAVTGEPVLDVAVAVVLLDENGDVVLTAVATTAQSANRLFYEADLEGVASGSYEMQVEVMGDDGGGTLSFPLRVQPTSIWPWVAAVLAGGAVLGLGVRFWRKGQKPGGIGRGTAVPRRRSVD